VGPHVSSELSPLVKPTGLWTWPLTSIYRRIKYCVAIHLHPSIRLYDLTLNQTQRQVHRTWKDEVVSYKIRLCGFNVVYFISEERIASFFRIGKWAKQESSRNLTRRQLLHVYYLAYSLILKWRRYIPPKRRAVSELYGITTQKPALSNPRWLRLRWESRWQTWCLRIRQGRKSTRCE
jgi:hypothetical protein